MLVGTNDYNERTLNVYDTRSLAKPLNSQKIDSNTQIITSTYYDRDL